MHELHRVLKCVDMGIVVVRIEKCDGKLGYKIIDSFKICIVP